MDHHPIWKLICKVFTVLSLLLSDFTGTFIVQAEDGNHAEKEVINVGFFAFEGYHMQDEDGTRSGYGYDFLQKLSVYTGWTYNYVGYDKSWSDMQEMLMDGTIDMVTSAQKTEERQKNFAFSAESIGTNSAVLTVKSGNTKYTAGDYTTYNGMKIGILDSSSRNDKLAAFAQEKGFTYTPVTYASSSALEEALQDGALDALFTSSLRVISNEWILDQFDSSDFYVMVRKDNTALLDRINDAIAQLDINYPDWHNDLWNQYYQADTGNEISFTAAERQYIQSLKDSGKTLSAIVEPDRVPYSYFADGKAEGIMPEVFYAIEQATGLSFDIVEAKSRQEYFDLLTSQQHIDVRIDSPFDYYQAEEHGYKLTDAYLTTNIDKVSGKATNGIAAVVKTGDVTQAREDLINGDLPIIYCNSYDECVQAVKDGRAEYTYLYSYTAQHYVDSDSTSSLKAVTLPQYSMSYAIGVAVDSDPHLITILDKAVNHVQGTITQEIILEQTNIATHSMTLIEYLQHNPILFVVVFMFIGLLFGMIILSIYRHRSIRLIAQKNKDLEAAIYDAKTANAAKSTFLSSMSHDMRTPLNGIISFTNFALNTKDNEKKQEYLAKVQKSSSVLKNLINDTLNVSRIESGKTSLYLQYASTKEIYENLTLVMAGAAAEKGITFHTSSEVPEDVYVNIDKTKMQEIFMNLLSNAIKYTPQGGTVWYDVKMAEEKDGRATFCFTVKDNGIGMSQEFQEKMFDSFTQEHQNDKTTEGTGLGLYIVKRYVDLMHGRIEVQSELGKGSTFVVYLSSEVKHVAETRRNTNADYDFTGVKILLVEDNAFNQEIAQTLLKQKGAEVDTADNGAIAVDKFEHSPEGYYQAVFMDIHMPVMDGFEATKKIRGFSRADAKSVPIIAMTADAYDQDVKNCMEAGMNAHVAKPIDTEVLYQQLDSLIHPDNSQN